MTPQQQAAARAAYFANRGSKAQRLLQNAKNFLATAQASATASPAVLSFAVQNVKDMQAYVDNHQADISVVTNQ